MRIYLVSFAEGKFYKRKRFINSLTAYLIGGVDYIYKFSYENIDPTFFKKNQQIFKNKKGLGFWLWKPYFINKVLQEIKNDDYIFYCDTASIFIKNIRPLVKTLIKSKQDIMSFELPLIECEWTKPKVINYFNFTNTAHINTNQITASFFIIKKNNFTKNFIEEWLRLCQIVDLIDDTNSIETDVSKYFKFHRNDQSIFSLLIKKYNIKPFRDPSQFGEFPEMYRLHSKIINVKVENSKYKTTILLVRKSNSFLEIFKYYTKKILKIFLPVVYNKILYK